MSNRGPAFDLRGAFQRKMDESRIDAASAKKLGYKALKADQAPKELPYAEAGIQIPYFDMDGKPTKFWRYRYLREPEKKGFSALVAKPLRYVQPGKSTTELYLPPIIKWRQVAAEPLTPIVITEGEFKAACVCLNTDHPCIGLGGVWSWKSASKRMPMLPGFKEFQWQGRPVFIIYDSDAATNPKVMQAENALARALTELGAEPRVVRLPALEQGGKTGLDDFIVARGAEDLDELMEAAEPWTAAAELHELNEEVVYVRDPGVVMRLDTLQRIAPRAFVDHAYSTRTYYEEQTDANGNTKLVAKSAPKEWLKWPGRAEVPRVTYAPGDERITRAGELNAWRGWGCEPEKGDVSLWNELLDYLFKGEPESRDWFERWLAYPLQHPGVKMYTSAVVWGLKHGTGKSFIGYSMFKIYGSNATEVKDQDLYASHNEWAENKQFVMGDEITAKDKRGAGDTLKGMITRQLLRLNPKFIPSYTVPDVINYFFTSNHPDSFFLEDDDRRMFIHEVVGDPLPREFYKRYEAWIGRPGVVGPGASALFYHLLNLDLKGMDAADRAPDTKAKQAMLETGRSDLASWVRQLKDDPDTVLRMGGQPVRFALMRSEDLLMFYDPEGKGRVTANGLARELTKQGFRKVYNGNGVPTKRDGQVRLWAVRDIQRMMRLSGTELGEFYDEERDFTKPKTEVPKGKEKFR